MIEAGLRAVLIADPGVSSLVANATSPLTYRVYPLQIPQHVYGEATKQPCIVYTKISADRQLLLSGTSNVVEAAIHVDCYANTYSDVLSLADAVRNAMIDYAGTSAGVRIKHISLDSEFAADEPDPGVYRLSQSWTCWYVE